MDNGLIFPYRRRTAHTELADAERLKPVPALAWERVERATQSRSR